MTQEFTQTHLSTSPHSGDALSMEERLAEYERLIEALRNENSQLRRELNHVPTEGLFERIIQSAPDIIYTSDHEGKFRFANQAAANLIKLSPAEIYGRNYTDLIDDQSVIDIVKEYIGLIKQKETSAYKEFKVKTIDNTELWVGQKVVFNYTEDGHFDGTYTIARDITEERQSKQENDILLRRFVGLLENLHAAVLVENEERKIVLVNQKFCDFFQIPVPPDYLIGADCAESAEQSKHFFKDPEAFVKRIETLLNEKKLALGDELEMVNGTILERHYIPVFRSDQYLGHLWHYTDITEKRHAQEILRKSEEKYRRIIETMQLGLSEISPNRTIRWVSPRFCEMTGYTQEELIGQDPRQVFIPEGDLERFQRWVRSIHDESNELSELPILKKDGSILWLMSCGTPQYDEKGLRDGYIGIHFDITSQKNLQADLDAARIIAEKARDAEKDFLANISHEIRNPINSILGMAHLLYDTTLNVEQAQYVNSLKYSAELLHSRVSEVLDIAKLDEGKISPKPQVFDLKGLLQGLARAFEMRLRDRHIGFNLHLDSRLPQYVSADPDIFTQIVLNLLGYAEKHAKQGKVGLSVSPMLSDDQQKSWLHLSVYYNGEHIAPERIPFLFERFNKSGEVNTGVEGLELSLYLTRRLTQILNGQVGVNSDPISGTKFKIELPITATDKVEIPLNQRPKETANPRVLIVEDNPINRLYLENLLRKWGLEYKSAQDGIEALQKLEQLPFDLILMDIRMPMMDGYETTLRLRNNSNSPSQEVPIIALTASTQPEEKVRAIEAGMNSLLSKPFTPEQLIELFQQYFPGFSIATYSNILDRDALHEIYAGDNAYWREMATLFLKTMPYELQILESEAQENDWIGFKAQAHKLKPSFTMVGLTQLGQQLGKMEELALAEHYSLLEATLPAFLTEAATGMEIIRQDIDG
jgi:PAS domain S-box-containing protein